MYNDNCKVGTDMRRNTMKRTRDYRVIEHIEWNEEYILNGR